MSIIFVGSELGEFDLDSTTTQTNSLIDSAYSRQGFQLSGTIYLRKTLPQTYSELWCACRWGFTSTTTVAGYTSMSIGNGTQAVARLQSTATSGQLQLERWNGTAWVSVGTPFTPAAVRRITMRVKLAVAGVISVYLDEALVASFEGNTSALPPPDRVFMANPSNSGAVVSVISEFILATHNIVAARLKTLAITANGANTGWTGNYLDIDAFNETTSSFISSDTAGQKSTFVVGDLPVDSLLVDAVIISGQFRKNATGPTGIKALTRVGGVDYGQTLAPLLESFGNRQSVFSVNPATAAPWAKAAVDALEIGVESVA